MNPLLHDHCRCAEMIDGRYAEPQRIPMKLEFPGSSSNKGSILKSPSRTDDTRSRGKLEKGKHAREGTEQEMDLELEEEMEEMGEEMEEDAESPTMTDFIAVMHIQSKEWYRAHRYLTDRDIDTPYSTFLRLYALYMSGERARQEDKDDGNMEALLSRREKDMVDGIHLPKERRLKRNPHATEILEELDGLDERGISDSFCWYL